jgi:hypothetical protein
MNRWSVLGLALMIGSQALTLAKVEPFWSWNTPICWTGFILFADGLVFQARGVSWLRSAPREFAVLAILSIPLWLVFEFFNLYIENWYYVGLSENMALRLFGYAWSFGTIWPAIFEGADLVGVARGTGKTGEGTVRLFDAARPTSAALPAFAIASIALGAAMLLWPIVWPSRYVAAPVWLGFIFLLDPINAWLGAPSLFTRPRAGNRDLLINLMASGLLCGLLWEFWNYWSRAKWHYTVPIMEHVKLFEMPLPGFLGFPAFALECFTMYVFVRQLARRAL